MIPSLHHLFFSSLARRIVLLNILGLAVLLSSILYLSQFREGLIDARVKSLITQGEIISAAIASSASVETNTLNIDAEKLLEQMIGNDGAIINEDDPYKLDFAVNPEKLGPVLGRLVMPTGTRARIFDKEGVIIIDSRLLNLRGNTDQDFDAQQNDTDFTELFYRYLNHWLNRGRVATYSETAAGGIVNYPEVKQALQGQIGSVVRMQEDEGSLVVFVAVPIQRNNGTIGALLLSTQGKDIDDVVTNERLGILRVFGVAAGVMLLLSMVMASTIATPLQRLSLAARRIRKRKKLAGEFPDYSSRHDEIGELSSALRDMTEGLEQRIEAIERFAADVAHELKNPLTSLHSAIETLPMAKKPEDQARLLDVIRHDIQRLDRLISDISRASRLDAELQRGDYAPVNVKTLLETVVNMAHEAVPVHLRITPENLSDNQLYLQGNDSRLAQVATNLIENAQSFSPKGSAVEVTIQRLPRHIRIMVEDSGPGIPAANLKRIFERFYTDRPNQNFGNNSGLGLSISQQIVEAHGGEIYAENRMDNSGTILGARFTVDLPAAEWR